MKFNELSAEAKAVFGILEIEDRLYKTKAQALTVNQKQFERCLELKKDTQQTIDCTRGRDCRIYGRCSAVDGWCRVTKDEDCAKSLRCKELGRCSAVRGICVRR